MAHARSMNLSTYSEVSSHRPACTALKNGRACPRPATRRSALNHPSPVCDTCYERLYRQGTVKCSVSVCTVRLVPRSRKGRTVPAPWCRRHEHLALSTEVLGEAGRAALERALVANIQADWDTGCWIWTGKQHKGYGRYKSKATGEWLPHRLAWHLFSPGHGLREELDHRHSGGTLCVSPLHLQPVTQKVNLKLRDLRRTAPDEHWYLPGDSGFVDESLYAFAKAHGLPLKTPTLDHSAQWEPASHERPASTVKVEPTRLAPSMPPEGEAEVDLSGLDFKKLHMSPRTFRDMKFSPEEIRRYIELYPKKRK